MTDTTEPINETPDWDPTTWDWTSNVEPPVDHVTPDGWLPTQAWPGAIGPGSWGWVYRYADGAVTGEPDPARELVSRWPGWYGDADAPAPKTALEIALEAQAAAVVVAERLRRAILADQTARPVLGLTVAGMSVSVARRDSLTEVNARQGQMLALLQQVLAVQGNLITALNDALERQASVARTVGGGG